MTEEHDKRVNDQLTGQAIGPAAQQFGEQTTITTGGGDQAGRDIEKRQGEVFVEYSIVSDDIIGRQHNSYQPTTTPLDQQQRRNRPLRRTKRGLTKNSLSLKISFVLSIVQFHNAVLVRRRLNFTVMPNKCVGEGTLTNAFRN